MLDTPPSSDEDLFDITLFPLPEVGGETLSNLAHLATTETTILDISNIRHQTPKLGGHAFDWWKLLYV
jgi:hypothetical protein